MSKDRNAFKAGLFIVVSVGLIIAVIISIKGAGRLLGPTHVRTVQFKLADDLGGLRVGDDVRVGGFKVGAVRSVDLIQESGAEPYLLVRFTIPRKYELREGAAIGVQTTLTGSSSLNVENLGTGTVLPEGTAVAGRPDPKTALLASLGEAGPQIQTTVTKANDFLDNLNSKVDPAYDKFANVADRFSETMVEARDLMGDTKGDFRGTIKNLNGATATINEQLPGLLKQTDGVLKKVDDALVKVQKSLDDVETTMANAKDLSASAKALLVNNRTKLDGVVTGLKATSDNLKAASAEIRRSPWRLLYKPGPGDMANLNLYDSARQFAEGAGALNDAATALRDTLDGGQATPEQVQKLVEQLEGSFTSFKQVEQELWAEVKER